MLSHINAIKLYPFSWHWDASNIIRARKTLLLILKLTCICHFQYSNCHKKFRVVGNYGNRLSNRYKYSDCCHLFVYLFGKSTSLTPYTLLKTHSFLIRELLPSMVKIRFCINYVLFTLKWRVLSFTHWFDNSWWCRIHSLQAL